MEEGQIEFTDSNSPKSPRGSRIFATLGILLAVAIVGFFFSRDDDVVLGPGVLALNDPIQLDRQSGEPFSFKEYTITPLARFYIQAKVLSKKEYSFGIESDLSPVDLALGWGNMSDEKILESVNIRQSNRWYRWSTRDFPIPEREIEMHSANMHIIPADETIKSQLNQAKKGDIVKFSGKLIKADWKDGRSWVSSLSRDDVGENACEVVWVDDFEIKKF